MDAGRRALLVGALVVLAVCPAGADVPAPFIAEQLAKEAADARRQALLLGLLLSIPIVGLEAVVLRLRANLNWGVSLGLAVLANGFSSAVGLVLAVSAQRPALAIPAALVGAAAVGFLLWCLNRAGSAPGRLRLALWSAPIVFTLMLGSVLLFRWSETFRSGWVYADDLPMVVGAWAAVLAAGFVLSALTEGFVLSRCPPAKSLKLLPLVLLMNLASYPLLAAVLGFDLWKRHSDSPFQTRAEVCALNLGSVQKAKEEWAGERAWQRESGTYDASVLQKLAGVEPEPGELFGRKDGQLLYLKFSPVCPSGGVYRIGRVEEPASCSVAGHLLRK